MTLSGEAAGTAIRVYQFLILFTNVVKLFYRFSPERPLKSPSHKSDNQRKDQKTFQLPGNDAGYRLDSNVEYRRFACNGVYREIGEPSNNRQKYPFCLGYRIMPYIEFSILDEEIALFLTLTR